jgi:hypothetical protein
MMIPPLSRLLLTLSLLLGCLLGRKGRKGGVPLPVLQCHQTPPVLAFAGRTFWLLRQTSWSAQRQPVSFPVAHFLPAPRRPRERMRLCRGAPQRERTRLFGEHQLPSSCTETCCASTITARSWVLRLCPFVVGSAISGGVETWGLTPYVTKFSPR